jgi:nitrogen-specific signal transduction histidine kinase
MNSPSFAGLELLDTPVLITHADGKLEFANPACENLLAIGRRELLRHSLFELLQDSPALRQACHRPATQLQLYRARSRTAHAAWRAAAAYRPVGHPIDAEAGWRWSSCGHWISN